MKTSLRTIAYYLPQFHHVKENDEWWGEGFTEWTAVKNAKPMFDGHVQPQEPLNDNYYDLSKKETMLWQADLAKKYDVGGMCFYHYWFKDGRKILEKPAENLLRWADVDMPFMFCWANETWARSWKKIDSKNMWASSFEPKKNDADSGILLEQSYGDKSQWKIHFEYLLPFFQDQRYIKIDNKPVFLIYRPELITCLDEMLDLWKKMAQDCGFSGIYVIGTNSYSSNRLDAVVYNMSKRTDMFNQFVNEQNLRGVSYCDLWEDFLNQNPSDVKTYWCGIVKYDDTPRHGNCGSVHLGATADKFKSYFNKMVRKSLMDNNAFVFLNAWNEWGEGMYLEPDKRTRYDYLESVKNVMEECRSCVVDTDEDNFRYKKIAQDVNNKEEYFIKRIDKFKHYFNLLDDWMRLKEAHKSILPFFERNGYRTISIYGAGKNAAHLLADIKDSGILVKYVIDRNKSHSLDGLAVFDVSDELPDSDVIVVTVVNEYKEIKEMLISKGCARVISLAEVIASVLETN